MAKLNAAYMGYRNREAGAAFEGLIQTALGWYEAKGIAKVEKTPEPMRPLSKPNGRGQFLACFTKQAQADYTGTMRDGRSVRFEAKQTDTEKVAYSRLTKTQQDDLDAHQKLGALCFVLLCFGADRFYRIPWGVWKNMKKIFGHMYVTEAEISNYRVPFDNGIIRIFGPAKVSSNQNNSSIKSERTEK